MASVRGGTPLWTGTAIVNGDTSSYASLGANTAVAVFIKNTGANSATFAIECGGDTVPQAGRNSSPTDWYQYVSRGDATVETYVVAAGSFLAIDLSPFAPPYLRLKCTANTSGTTVTAFVVSNQ